MKTLRVDLDVACGKRGKIFNHLPVCAVDEGPDENKRGQAKADGRDCYERPALVAKNVAPRNFEEWEHIIQKCQVRKDASHARLLDGACILARMRS